MSGPQQVAIAELGAARQFSPGEFLIREGSRERSVFVLLNGQVKVLSTDVTGRGVLLAVRLEGDLVGELAALDGDPRSASVEAASYTATRMIGHAEFQAHLTAHPDVAAAVHRSVVAKLRQATRIRTDLGSATVLAKLATVLVHLGHRYGVSVPQGTVLDLHLSQADLAALITVGEKSVHRALATLRERGFVRSGRHRQLLLCDIEGLAAVASEDD